MVKMDAQLWQARAHSNCLQVCALWISGMPLALFRYRLTHRRPETS